jgi:hypothetical protein
MSSVSLVSWVVIEALSLSLLSSDPVLRAGPDVLTSVATQEERTDEALCACELSDKPCLPFCLISLCY